MNKEANPRQIAFARLVKLFTEVVMAVPSTDITQEQLEAASTALQERFTAIMDEYDRNRMTMK